MPRLRSFALALACSILPFSAAAQQTPRPLSLEQAYALARENNPALRRSLAETESNAAQERARWGAFLPSLSASLSFGGYQTRTLTGVDQFGQTVLREDPLTFRGSSASQGLALGSLTLFDGGQRLRELRAAQAVSRAGEARVAGERVRLGAELGRRYYDAVRRERLIALEERLLASARERLEITQRQLRVVASTPVDVLGAEVDVARQEQAADRARGEARKALLALQEEMGVANETDFLLTDEPPPVFDPGSLDAGALVAEALAASPRIAQLDAGVEAAEHRVRAARGARWPTVSGYAGFGRSFSTQGYDAFFDFNPPNQNLNFGLNVALPLFDQFRTSSSVAQSTAGRAGAQEELRAGQLALEREVRSALIDLENAYRGVRLAERAAALAAERLEMAREQYRLGLIPFTSLQTVVEQAAQADRDALNARFDFATARVTLEERAGSPVAPSPLR
jgi:outer membrane protein